jgi:hypothetical protein
MKKSVLVKQRPGGEIPTEILADNIKSISESMKKLRSGRLNDRALHLLIQHAAPKVGGDLTEVSNVQDQMSDAHKECAAAIRALKHNVVEK